MTFAEHVADAAYHASLVGHLVLPYDYLSRPLAKRMAIAEPWYHELMQREADAEPRACWLLRNFPMLRYRDRPADFVPPPPRSGLRSACVIGPVAYVGGAERWAESLVRSTRDCIEHFRRDCAFGNHALDHATAITEYREKKFAAFAEIVEPAADGDGLAFVLTDFSNCCDRSHMVKRFHRRERRGRGEDRDPLCALCDLSG